MTGRDGSGRAGWVLLVAFLALAMTSLAPVARAEPVARADMGGPAGVAALNRLRAANGIPPVKEDPALSKGCRLHDVYMSEHPNLGIDGLIHSEQPGLKGYTKLGAYAASHAEVAFGIVGWDPWDQMPLHLAGMLTPYVQVAGFYQTHGFSCLAIDGTTNRSQGNALFTYPGNRATNVAPAWDTSSEYPSPNQMVGLARGRLTGTDLIIMASGPWIYTGSSPRIVSAKLAPANDPHATSTLKIIQGKACEAACEIIIPVDPLEPGTSYHASVTVASGKTRLSHDWYFTTGDSPLAAKSTPAKKPKRAAGHGRISRLALSRRTVSAGLLARVQVGYRLSGASRLVVELKRPTPDGVATGTGLCVSPHYRGTASTAPSCTYWQTIWRTHEHASAGAHRASLRALLHGKTLAPGRYRLTVHADANAKTVAFTVER